MHACMLSRFSCVRLFATLWTVAHQASLSMEFSRQEYWSGLPCSPPGDLPDTGIEPSLLRLPVLANGFFKPLVPPQKPLVIMLLLLLSHVSRVRLCATP